MKKNPMPGPAMFAVLLFIGGMSSNIFATSYYSDPVGGSMANDGSEGSPWGSMRDVFEAQTPFSAGDVLFLMNGAHGQSYISEAHTNYVAIRAYPGHTPKASTILLDNGASYWAFDGITFTVDGSGGPTTRNYLMSMTDKASHVKVENCTFYSAEDSSGWSKVDWYANTADGLYLDGDHVVFNSNTVKNVYHALQVEGDYAEVRHNLIDNFGADAIRAVSSHAVYESNVIRDAYIEDYNLNHDDAIQMYDKDNIAGGVVEDVVIRNNTILGFADPITQAMIDDGLVGYSMQGIIVTDGWCSNMVVENNLVVGDHYHGITLAGPVDCRVQNNTVIKTPTSVNPVADALPWVQLDVSKRGVQPANSILHNNIASKLTPWTYAGGTNIQDGNNLEPATNSYSSYFTNYGGFDFNLAPGSPAIDAGTNSNLTATDLAGQPRLVGPNVDCGAYEFQSAGDPFPPELSEARNTFFNDEVVVVFNESVTSASAENVDHYLIDGGIAVTNASLSPDSRTATLRTTALIGGLSYTVMANGVEDHAGNSSSNTSAHFTYLCNTNWASTYQDDEYGTNPPEDAFDGDLNTKWAAEGSEWIQTSLCRNLIVESVEIAFGFGNQRRYSFTIDVSSDGRTFTQVFSGLSAGTSLEPENFDFPDVSAKYVKINGLGNNVNAWNNYTEIVVRTLDPAEVEYASWIGQYPGVGAATNRIDNPDRDALDNLYEWGLGGNPDDAADLGHVPTFGSVADTGANTFEYVYAKRVNAAELGLSYYLEQSFDLTEGSWSNALVHEVETGVLDGEFNRVINRMRIGGEGAKYLRLIIEAH